MNLRKLIILPIVILSMTSCSKQNPNLNEKGKDEFQSLEVKKEINKDNFEFQDRIYVPIYSDIYVDSNNPKQLLSATLSIRNTSFNDSLFVSSVDYYNTEGKLVKSFLENTISLPPMATVNYVIEKDDDTGGSGANFIVDLSSKSLSEKPLIQAIMVGEFSNKAFSFKTDGYSLQKKKR